MKSEIHFNHAANAELDELIETTTAKSRAEVVRNGLSTYAYLSHELLKNPDFSPAIINLETGAVDTIIRLPEVIRAQARKLAEGTYNQYLVKKGLLPE